MKKTKLFAYVCLVALVSAGMSSCKNDQNDPLQANKQITADIALSLPNQVGSFNGARRMPSSTVQAAGATDFATNGMKNINLIPFASKTITGTSNRLSTANILLENLTSANNLSDNANGRAKVYTGVQVPLGTSAFLFYGESGKTSSNFFEVGSLTGTLDVAQPQNISFVLKAIQPNATTVSTNAAYTGLIDYLNCVASASDGTTAWKDYTALQNEGFKAMFDTLATTKVLSSFGIAHLMTDLYQSLKTNNDDLAKAICDSIKSARFVDNVDGDVVTLISSLQNFPESLGLPVGCLAVAYNTTSKEFGGNAVSAFGGLNPAAIDNFVYPASLWYFANSKIKTSPTSKLDNYTGARSWASILGTYEQDDASVTAATRSIAIKDTIQYAVARLDVQLRFKEGTTLDDNDPVATNRTINNPVAGYPLKAVLIGGQRNVGFDFTPGAGTAYTVYDTLMTTDIAAASTSYSATNSTLVLETPADENVFIAIELVNTSDKDFYGYDGIVPVGGHFYLVGQLSAAAATETDNKVFKQDYTTTARIAIKDLKSAYNTIPDLKAKQLEIGFSVDLTWQSGHTYELEL